jgi:hypothetical protein
MRRLFRILAVLAAFAIVTCGAVVYWRRHPRLGTTFVNLVVNPVLLRRGLAGGAKSEIGTIEHFGRRSGIRRLTPVHPEPTADGFRVIVPLAEHSAWARNVLAAGHCRLQLHDTVYELDEPTIVRPSEVDGLPGPVRFAEAGLGFQYLKLRTFAAKAGTLEPLEVNSAVSEEPRSMSAAQLTDVVPV